MRWCDKEKVESGFHFPPTYLKSVEIPFKSNWVSSRPEIKKGLIYYLISKYTVPSRKERSINQFQKASSSFLIIGLSVKFLCYQVRGITWMVYRHCVIFFPELSNMNEVKHLRLFSKFFTLCKCQSIGISEDRAMNQLDSRNMNESKFRWYALIFLK